MPAISTNITVCGCNKEYHGRRPFLFTCSCVRLILLGNTIKSRATIKLISVVLGTKPTNRIPIMFTFMTYSRTLLPQVEHRLSLHFE